MSMRSDLPLTFDVVSQQIVDETSEETAGEDCEDILKMFRPLTFCLVTNKCHVDEAKDIKARRFLASQDLMTLSASEDPSAYCDSMYYFRRYHDLDKCDDKGYIAFKDAAMSRYFRFSVLCNVITDLYYLFSEDDIYL